MRGSDGELIHRFCQCHAVSPLDRTIHQSGSQQFIHNGKDTARTVHILHMVSACVRSHLAKARNLPGKHINVIHRKVGLRLLCHCQQMKDRIGRTAHGNVQRHGIKERLTGGNVARQNGFISVPVIFVSILHNQFRRITEKLEAIGMCSQNSPIARKCQTDCLVQAVHGVGSKHSGTTTTARTGMAFHVCNLLVTDRCVSGFNHRINQIQMTAVPLTCFHRTARNKDSRDVQTHGSHQHARRNLVAIADADHGICFVGIHHIFNAVRNDIARRQRIKHSIMSHRNPVVNGYRIEFSSKTAQLLNFRLDQLSGFMQMHMTRDKLGKRIHNGNYRFPELLSLHPVGTP